MIICQCRVISDKDLKNIFEDLAAQGKPVTMAEVSRTLPPLKCGACVPAFRQAVQEYNISKTGQDLPDDVKFCQGYRKIKKALP